jgi:hypothetical protein
MYDWRTVPTVKISDINDANQQVKDLLRAPLLPPPHAHAQSHTPSQARLQIMK